MKVRCEIVQTITLPLNIEHLYFCRPSRPMQISMLWRFRGLVKISAAWAVVGMWMGEMYPASTVSCSQWNQTSRCFIQPWCSGFFATVTAELLSMRRGNGEVILNPNSVKRFHIQMISFPASTAAIYSTSVVESETTGWRQLLSTSHYNGISTTIIRIFTMINISVSGKQLRRWWVSSALGASKQKQI